MFAVLVEEQEKRQQKAANDLPRLIYALTKTQLYAVYMCVCGCMGCFVQMLLKLMTFRANFAWVSARGDTEREREGESALLFRLVMQRGVCVMKFCLPCALITELKATECNTNQSSWSNIPCILHVYGSCFKFI